jgi:WD40 repeat protein/serine/threonine protein kinase
MAVDPARAKSLFLAASDLDDPAARAAYLDGACGDDAALRRRVDALLGAHEGGVDFAGGRAAETAGPAPCAAPVATAAGDGETLPMRELAATIAGDPRADRPAGSDAGRVIAGRYTLLDVLGEGGMGTVYRADQSAPVKRQVALKLIRIGMDSRVVLARFDAERQALALMDHPHIARVYDGGTTEDGRPFFVMELVSGEPITEYCDRLRLPVRARLELFVPVCQAVQHAHQKGVIHRDLKPGNVMVTEVDGRPTPKVIDFGVATATDFQLTDHGLGDAAAIVGTPTYMSPEQADPASMDIDTRTDVYALGVILYELLAGSPPIDARQLKRGAILEMLRMVREVDPPSPSTKVSTADALPSIAASRDVEPSRLKRALRGDLDWIVMRALEKDRDRRYATANGLAADIRRHLASEPVVAAPPSRAYRLRKFVRRHRGAVMAASLVLLALLAGMAGTTWGLFEARRQEAAAGRYADEAKGQAKAARDNAKRADAEARSARRAEREARDHATAEAAAKAIAQQETRRAEAETLRAEEQLTRAQGLLYAGKIAQAQNDFEAGDGGTALRYLDECQASLRGWEHRYLWTRINAKQTLVGHRGPVWGAAYSLDGRRIVTGSGDRTAKVWDARTGGEILALGGHTDEVHGVAFRPDGGRVATASIDGTARVWDAATGRELLAFRGHTAPVLCVAFSPDGGRIASGTGAWASQQAAANEVKVWDAATGRELLALEGLTRRVFSVAFHPDGGRLLTGMNDGTARVWDAATGRGLLTLEGHAGGVLCAAFSPDGRRIVTGGEDNTARVWDAATGQEQHLLKGHAGFVWSVAFSPDGERIASGSYDRTVKVWDAATGRERHILKGHAGFVRSVAFSPDGGRILSGSEDTTARVWDAQEGQDVPVLRGHRDFVKSIAYSPDGRRILTGSGDGTAKLWDPATGRELRTFRGHAGRVRCVAFSPDGRRIVTGSDDTTARLWDAATGRVLLTLEGHTGELWGVACSPDGKRLVSGGADGTVRVWDAENGRELRTLKGHADPVFGVAFSPDGERIASGGADRTVRVWDAETGRELRVLEGHAGGVTSVAFRPDGRRILTGSLDRTLRLWDVATGRELRVLKGHTDVVWGVAFSPDGERIASGSYDRTARVWDAATGQEVLALRGHADDVLCVAFSPDGGQLASGIAGVHATVTLWPAERGQDVLLLRGHTDVVTSVAFCPDGQHLFGWDAQKTLLAWWVADGRRFEPVNPPPMPPPGPARSPDGFRLAMPEGKTIAVTDRRPPAKDNAWPLPATAEGNPTHAEAAAPPAQGK